MTTHYTNLDGRPWYQEPWPWIIMGLLGSVIIASLITLWIAVSNPDALVVDDAQYREIRGGLRAQNTESTQSTPQHELEPSPTDEGS